LLSDTSEDGLMNIVFKIMQEYNKQAPVAASPAPKNPLNHH
jgi:hypothetical protein